MEWVASTLHNTSELVYPALLPLMCTPRLPVVDAPAELNGLVRFAERRNLVSVRVPSHFKRSLRHNCFYDSENPANQIFVHARSWLSFVCMVFVTSIQDTFWAHQSARSDILVHRDASPRALRYFEFKFPLYSTDFMAVN